MNMLDVILGPIFKVIDKIIPDPAAKAQMQLDILKLQQAGEFKEIDAQLQVALAQAQTNTTEAASNDPFVSRWRPFIGWICGAGFAVEFVIGPLGAWLAAMLGHPIAPPKLDVEPLVTMLAGMLGLGSLRTYEKVKGVSK